MRRTAPPLVSAPTLSPALSRETACIEKESLNAHAFLPCCVSHVFAGTLETIPGKSSSGLHAQTLSALCFVSRMILGLAFADTEKSGKTTAEECSRFFSWHSKRRSQYTKYQNRICLCSSCFYGSAVGAEPVVCHVDLHGEFTELQNGSRPFQEARAVFVGL